MRPKEQYRFVDHYQSPSLTQNTPANRMQLYLNSVVGTDLCVCPRNNPIDTEGY